MDNALAHPPALVEDTDDEYDFMKVKFSPNMTPYLQPMDQKVICNFKKFHTKVLFTRCFNVTEETFLTLKEFWKKHFSVLHCINLIDKCVAECDFERSGGQEVEGIVCMGKIMNLGVNGADIEELVEDHEEELTREKLAELQSEQQKALLRSIPRRKRKAGKEISSNVIKSIMEKWNECQDFFEKHHPNVTVTNSAESDER